MPAVDMGKRCRYRDNATFPLSRHNGSLVPARGIGITANAAFA